MHSLSIIFQHYKFFCNRVKQYVMEKTNAQKKKLPLAVRIILLPFKLILGLLVIILLWFIFCRFDRISPINALPPDYAVYVRSDKVWNTFEPLMDLDATLIALSTPELQQYRETYLNLKSSKLRQNFFVKKALKRRLDSAVYEKDSEGNTALIAVLDTGFLAGATRLAPLVIPRIKKLTKMLEFCSNENGVFYKLQDAGYLAIKKNLIIFSTNRELMPQIMTYSNEGRYKVRELQTMKSRMKEPLRILADGKNLANLFPAEESVKNYIDSISQCLSKEDYASLTFGITNSELTVNVKVPLGLEDEEIKASLENHPVVNLLKKESKVPVMLPKFTEDVQYYSLINAGKLSELKDAAMKILPPEKHFDSTWNKADSACKMLFNKTLDDILFSWTGDEFAVFGIEGKSEPVFGLKISNEELRREIFESIFSSFIIQANDSLFVDGIRLPCIEIPQFFLGVLQALDINVPKPYFFVKDDFIYFSQSPENLVAINAITKKTVRLSNSENWKRVSSKLSPYTSLSLYYNLERSIPFFIKGNTTFSRILSLYNSGRFDVKLKDNEISVQLQASSIAPESSKHIPGFPIALKNKSDAILVKSNAKSKKSTTVFWLENDGSVNSLDCGTFAQESIDLGDVKYIAAASENTAKSGGELWALTSSGMVYLLNNRLEVKAGYPILTGGIPTCAPFIYKDSFAFTSTDGLIYFINTTGNISTLETQAEDSIKSTPAVNGDTIAFYEKGFFGGIHVYKNNELQTTQGPLELEGIAYGSPCLINSGKDLYYAMITQAGQLYVYDFESELLPLFPLELDGVFFQNVKACGEYIFAISSDGELYRVNLRGNTIQVKIPYFSAKSGTLTVFDYDDDGNNEIFVTGEGNVLYGFDQNLELLPAFPIPGYGNPVFTDLNGDNKKDCMVITFDNTIAAENVLK